MIHLSTNNVLPSKRFALMMLSSAIFFMIITTESLSAQSKTSNNTRNGAQSVVSKGARKLTLDELTQQSEVIAVGKVTAQQSEWTKNKERIQTRVVVSVDQTIKGSMPGSSMTIIIPGGEVDGVGEWYSHSLRFAKDEDVVLFAKKDGTNDYHVTGGESGKFSISTDEQTGTKIISNLGTLKDFSSKIRNTVKLQDAGTINKNN